MATRGTRPLVESALLAALAAVLMLMGWYVPVIGIVASLVSPLPAAVVVIRHGGRWGIMSSIVTLFVMTPIVGIATAAALWAVNGAMGLSFGFAVRRHYRPAAVLVTAAAGSLIALVAEYASAYFLTGLSLTKQINEILAIWNQALESTQKMLGPNPAMEQLFKSMTVEMMLALIPAILVMSAFLLAYTNFEIFRRILPRLGYNLEPLPPFSRWIFPEYMAHAGLAAFFVPYLQGYIQLPWLSRASENVFAVTSIVFLLEAISVGVFYLVRSGMSRSMAGVFAFLAVSMIIGGGSLTLLVTLFGMIDILFDFRRLRYGPLNEI